MIDELGFSAAGTIDNLRFLRLAAVIGIVALALLLFRSCARAGLAPPLAALIAVLVCTTTPFQVFASWAVVVSGADAALLGGAASVRPIRLRVRSASASQLLPSQPQSCWSWRC